jgi:hypothetical protein
MVMVGTAQGGGHGLMRSTGPVPGSWLLSAATATTAPFAAPARITTAPPKDCPTSTMRVRPCARREPIPVGPAHAPSALWAGRRAASASRSAAFWWRGTAA